MKKLIPALLCGLYVLFTALFVSHWHIRQHESPHMQIEIFAKQDARRPYVYRVLSPNVTYYLAQLAEGVGIEPKDIKKVNVLNKLISFHNVPDKSVLPYAVMLLFAFSLHLITMFILKRLLERVYSCSRPCAAIFPLFYTAMLFPFFPQALYIYDFAVPLIWSLALLSLHSGKFPIYYLLLFLGILNKETMVLFTLVAAFFIDRSDFKKWRTHMVAHVALFTLTWSIIYLLVDQGYAHTEYNNLIRDHWNKNLLAFWEWRVFTDYYSMATSLLILLFIFRRFRQRPRVIQCALTPLPVLFLLYLRGGVWGEIRVFYEVMPFLSILIFYNFVELLQDHKPLRQE